MSSALRNHKQFLVVTTPSWEAVEGQLQRYENGTAFGDPIPVVVGKNGMGRDKKEGDMKAPAGLFSLGSLFGFKAPHEVPYLKMPYFQITPTTEAIDDPESAYYNSIIDSTKIPCDWKSSEKMAEVSLYQLGAVINYNLPCPKKGAGSAIFMHIWRNSHQGTHGCTAMSLENLEKIFSWLDPKLHPLLIQYPIVDFEKLILD